MSRPATEVEAGAFCAALAEKFHARVVKQGDAIEFALLRQLLEMLKVPDITTLLRERVLVLGPLVYLPDGLTPDETIDKATHALQHVYQFWAGGLGFAWLYLSEGEKRAAFEAEAMRAALEVAHWRTGRLPPLEELELPLEGYLLDAKAEALAAELLEVAATSVAAGVPGTMVGREAIRWLAAHAPDLQAGR